MRTVSLSEARATLDALIDQARAGCVQIAIKRRDGEGVVLISEGDWALIMETLNTDRIPSGH